MHVLSIPGESLERFRLALGRRGAKTVQTTNPHEAHRLEMGRFQVVIYATGKVTLSDPRLVGIVEEALTEVLPAANGTVIGSDETGKGEWLGPLVVAACAVRPGDRVHLVAHGVMDSKLVTRASIPVVARAIEARTQLRAVTLIAPPKFNELFARFHAEGKSLNDMLAWAHARALAEAIAKFEAATGERTARVVVDEFARVKTEVRTSRAFDVSRYPVEQRVRAEDEVAVGAASILAKAAYEGWIDAYEKRAGIPARSLAREKAREHQRVAEFAKVSYLQPK